MSYSKQDMTILLSRPKTLNTIIESLIKTPSSSSGNVGPKCWWTHTRLITTLIIMAWSKGVLCDCFRIARKVFPTSQRNPSTYQGFIKALQRVGLIVLLRAKIQTQQNLHEQFSDTHRIHGFIALAVDGSRFELPRTLANEKHLGTGGVINGPPQLWVTSMWHLGAGLPWDWRVGPGNASENDHLRQMVDDTPKNALIIGDANFVSYRLIRQIVEANRDVIVRAGSAIHLIEKLAYFEKVNRDTVYLWPRRERKKKQPPLVMRLVRVRTKGDGRKYMYLLTSVLEHERLSDKQVGDLYRKRWEIETGYRSLKQTLDRQKLKSHAPKNILFEIHGLMLGLMVLGMIGVTAIVTHGYETERWSVAESLRVMRFALYHPRRKQVWKNMLCGTLIDPYQRKNKAGRYQKKKDPRKPPPRKPQIHIATAEQINLYLQVMIN